MPLRNALLKRLLILVVGVACALPAAAQRREAGKSRRARNPAPQVGETAPPVKLKTLDGKAEVDIADFLGKRPVVLLFGSYT